MDEQPKQKQQTDTSPVRQGRYYGDGGLYKYVKIPVKTVEYIIVALIVILLFCVIFGALNGGYTITFDAQGGTRVEAQKLEYGDLVAEPAPPVMEGHTFLGWFRDEACTQPWDFQNDTVFDSVTLYAGWTE